MLIGKNTLIKGYLKSTAEEYALNNDLRFEAIDYVHISDITLDKTSVQINRAETFTLIATISPSNATNKNITYKSSDETIVKVSESGVVTGIKVGKARITVTTEDGNKTAICDVEVMPKQITGIEVTTVPTKTNYIQNYENLDLTEGEITVRYNDETTDVISLTNEKIKVTGFDNSQIGINTITVEYEGKTSTFKIEIIENQNNPIDKDDTISSGIFPQAGNQYTLITIIILVIIITVIFYKKWKNIKHIK